MEDFEESLGRHLRAIRDRDLDELGATLADELVLVTSDGEVVHGKDAFLRRHAEWFAMDGWSLDVSPIVTRVTPRLATCLLRLDYRERREDGVLYRPSLLHLAFEPDGDRWLMVEDQNTPVRAP